MGVGEVGDVICVRAAEGSRQYGREGENRREEGDGEGGDDRTVNRQWAGRAGRGD